MVYEPDVYEPGVYEEWLAAMGFSAAGISVLSRIAASLVVPVTNIAYDAFGGPRFEPATGSIWIRPVISGVGSDYLAWGGTAKHTLHDELLRVQVFSRKGDGEKESGPIAESLADLFDLEVVDGLHFGPSYIERVPTTEKESWHQIEVSVPFHRQETKT